MNESIQIEEDEILEDDDGDQDDYDDGDDQDDDQDDQDDQDGDGDDQDDDDGDDQDDDATAEPANQSRRKGRRSPREPFVGDAQSQQALEFLSSVLTQMKMNCHAYLRRPREEDGRDIRLEIEGPDTARVIGKRGQVLGALQFLSNRILNRPGEERRYVTVDAEGYRSRRDNSLAAMAKRLGKQAVTDGKIITFEPMPPRDRRLVHLALAKFEGVVTKSEGDGEDRRVQIIPVRRT